MSYPANYVQIMGYFRAIFVKQELSQRAFDLCAEVIAVNAGNYTAWHYRRKLLHALNKDIAAEL